MHAIWRSPGPSLMESVFELMAPPRCDPGYVACCKPILALRSGLLRNTVPGGRIAEIWHLQFHAGPLCAVHDACRRLGWSIDPTTWTIIGRDRIHLLSTPAAQISMHIGHAWCERGRSAFTARWPALSPLLSSPDTSAIDSAMRPITTEARIAALRILMVDVCITQVRASHWVPGGKTCPRCQSEDGSVYHRPWTCPAWDRRRFFFFFGMGGASDAWRTHSQPSR